MSKFVRTVTGTYIRTKDIRSVRDDDRPNSNGVYVQNTYGKEFYIPEGSLALPDILCDIIPAAANTVARTIDSSSSINNDVMVIAWKMMNGRVKTAITPHGELDVESLRIGVVIGSGEVIETCWFDTPAERQVKTKWEEKLMADVERMQKEAAAKTSTAAPEWKP